ncbi:DNA-directed DNA polymerase alpha catalytic subunit pol1, partial [Coemansia thaxteri]
MDVTNSSEDPFALPPTKKLRQDDTDNPFLASDVLDAHIVVKQEQIAESTAASASHTTGGADHSFDDSMLLLDGLEELDETSAAPLYAVQSEPQGQNWQEVQNTMANHRPELAKQESAMSIVSDEPAVAGGDLRMYWIDAVERNNNVYLFGKVAHGSSYQSCCVQVSNIERNVFLLPRIDPATNERFDALDVHRDFEEIALRSGVRDFACKPVERKYAFEIAGVPASAEYLKVVYAFSQPVLPADISGSTFERAFGTTYSALELLLLKRRMMGPCWLEIKGARMVEDRDHLSWCRLEVAVDDPKLVSVLSDDAIA